MCLFKASRTGCPCCHV
ncbi:rCG58640 [Rattus norvegicus]|uniref:RCG58640 n=1 Tax=Rattus norvegicus TaxID=10116 RepID=A6JL39_RAT|nr:rCG58640 [Rattus norvegicus]